MLERIKKNKILVIALVSLLVLCTLTQSYIPGVYSMPENSEEVAAVSEEITTQDALKERMNEIEDADIYMEVGKYVYDVLEEADNEDSEAVKEEDSGAESLKAESEEKSSQEEEVSKEADSKDSDSDSENLDSSGAKKTSEDDISLRGYPWSNLNDEEFSKWVCDGEHDNYLKRTIENKKDTTAKEALDARIYQIVGSEIYMTVSDYLYILENPEKAVENRQNGETEGTTKAVMADSATHNLEKVGNVDGKAGNGDNKTGNEKSVSASDLDSDTEKDDISVKSEAEKKTGEGVSAENGEKGTESVKTDKVENGVNKADKVTETEKEGKAEKTESITAENGEKDTESVKGNSDETVYPWDGMTDEEFAEWITGGEHNSYISEILTDNDEERTEAEALQARIKDMQAENLSEAVSNHMKGINSSEKSETEKSESAVKNDDVENNGQGEVSDSEIITDSEEVSLENLPKVEEIAKEKIVEDTYFWDYMTDEELAAWILGGENDEYIKKMIEENEAEKAEAEKDGAKESDSDKGNDSVEGDTEEVSDTDSDTNKEENLTEAEALNNRIENMEDRTLWETVRDYVHDLIFGKYYKITLEDEETGVSVTGKLPENTELEVIEMDEKQVAEFIEEGQQLTFAYDITLIVDGKEYQPETSVYVKVPSDRGEDAQIKVQHVEINKKTGEAVATEVENEVDKDGNVKFEAESFSLYFGTEVKNGTFIVNSSNQEGFDIYKNYTDANPIAAGSQNYSLGEQWDGWLNTYLSVDSKFYAIARKGYRITGIKLYREDAKTNITSGSASAYSTDTIGNRTWEISLSSGLTGVTNSVYAKVSVRTIPIITIPNSGNGISECKVIETSSGINGTDKNKVQYTSDNANDYEADTNSAAQTIKISLSMEKGYVLKNISIGNADGSSGTNATIIEEEESEGIYLINIPKGFTTNQRVNVETEENSINIGTVTENGNLLMRPGTGYAFYCDSACTTKINSAAAHHILNAYATQTVYVKSIEGMGYTISGVSCKNFDDSTGNTGVASGPLTDGAWKIDFGTNVVKNQIITVTTTRSGNVDLYIDQGNINFTNDKYSGKNRLGEDISDVHYATDNYTIHQTDHNTMSENHVDFSGEISTEYKVTLDNINIGQASLEASVGPGAGPKNTSVKGIIFVSKDSEGTYKKKNVKLLLQGENIVRGIRYCANENTGGELTIDSATGSGSTEGKLYIPKKVAENEIESFVNSNENYNHWNAGIGPNDDVENMYGLYIKGGTIQVLTTKGDNCTAIGGGGNGFCKMSITGGNITAICNGTGAAIGGGIGYNSAGGNCDIEITGGTIFAENYGLVKSGDLTVGGVAIGGGSSFLKYGSEAKIVISNSADIEAYAAYGNGIGSGNSAKESTSAANIEITGGTIKTNAIGGGSSESAAGGSGTIIAKGGTVNCINYGDAEDRTNKSNSSNFIGAFGIGGGTSKKGNGGNGTVTVSGSAILNCNGGTIGGGTSVTNGTGGKGTITVNGTATLNCNGGTIGGGIGKDGAGGAAEVEVKSSGATLNCNKNNNNGGVIGGGSSESETAAAGGSAEVTVSAGTLNAGSIGGGTSKKGNGGIATINVSGGSLIVEGKIGGGEAKDSGAGGNASIRVTGGTLDCASIGGGNSKDGTPGAVTGKDGEAGVYIEGNSVVKSGSIGGGTNESGAIGYAGAEIKGGSIQGQFILSNTDSSKKCKFTMYGGTIDNSGLGTGKYIKEKTDGGAVYLTDDNGEVKINGGTIKNCNGTKGGAIYLSGENGTVTVEGGSIENCHGTSGGAVYMTAGTFTLSGTGTMKNCYGDNGGCVYMKNGTFNISNSGKIKNCKASNNGTEITGNGGAIYLEDGTINVSGGTIGTQGEPNKGVLGGGVYLAAGTMKTVGGSIEYNEAVNKGGGAYLAEGSKLEVSETGAFEDNKAQNGGGAYLAGGDLEMTGGSFSSNTSSQNGGGAYLENGTMDVSGGIVGQNTATNQGGGAYLAIGSKLKVSGTGAFNKNGAQNGGGAYLAGGDLEMTGGSLSENNSANDGGGAYLSGGKLSMEGGKLNGNISTQNGGGAYLNGGEFLLNGNSASVQSNKSINGGGIYLNGGTPTLKEGSIGGNIASGNGGGIYINKKSITLDLENSKNVSIINNRAGYSDLDTMASGDSTGSGGGIYIFGDENSSDDGKFEVAESNKGSVSISLNKAKSDGGGVAIKNGTFLMNGIGVSITENRAEVNGGGVALSGGNVNMNDGAIGEDGKANSAEKGGGVYVSGDMTVNSGNIQYNEAKLGGGVFLTGGEFTLSGANAKINDNKAEKGAGVYLTGGDPVLKEGAVKDNIASIDGGGLYIIQKDVSISLETGKTVEISGNCAGYTNKDTIGDTSQGNGGGIYITKGGVESSNASFTIPSENKGIVNIINNKSKKFGGGVCVKLGSFTLNNENGKIIGNSSENGGGVAVLSGNADVFKGTIGGDSENKNSATNGGGVYVEGGSFKLNGNTKDDAKVDNNQATNGGGIYLTGGDPLLLQGTISNNTADENGGGIYINQRIVTLNPTGNVNIDSNNAKNGGGVYINGTNGNDAGFGVEKNCGGEVDLTENHSSENGGAVCINKGYFNLDSEKIKVEGNRADKNGGGVAVLDGNFVIKDGTIGKSESGNSALSGGGVFVSGGNALINGGVIHHNNCTSTGGGLYVAGGLVVIKDGTIESNLANVDGGGVAVSDGKILMISGAVESNTAVSGNGGGMFVESQNGNIEVSVLSGSVSNNQAGKKGGGISVIGGESNTATITIGINHRHDFPNGKNNPFTPFTYGSAGYSGTTYNITDLDILDNASHSTCPEIRNNSSGNVGGGVYITGSISTALNLYCLDAKGNLANDVVAPAESESNFMMVDGGKVIISTASEGVEKGKDGNASIDGTICVTGGQFDIYGVMTNPDFSDCLTVNIEKDEDHFEDHREMEEGGPVFYKLQYYENFEGKGQYKSFQLLKGTEESIRGSIYSHQGYKIVGWNTEPTGSGVSYTIGDKWTFNGGSGDHESGDLMLYAVWEPVNYKVHFNVNAPEGRAYSGTMEDQSFTYGTAQNLSDNQFSVQGYTFKGWTTNSEGEGTLYANCQSVKNLADEEGELAQLYAKWGDCEHNDLSYMYYACEDGKMIEHCRCGKHDTVVSIEGAISRQYNGTAMNISLSYSPSQSDWKGTKGVLTYLKKNSSGIYEDCQGSPSDVGQYRAIVKFADSSGNPIVLKNKNGVDVSTSLYKDFEITKADQLAPNKPTYEISDDKSYLIVGDVGGTNSAGTAGHGTIQYMMKYKSGDNWYYAGNGTQSYNVETWFDEKSGGGYQFEFPTSYTTYYIYARYKGDGNYNASPGAQANMTYTVMGNSELIIINGEGIIDSSIESHGEGNGANGVDLKFSVDSDYYLLNNTPVSAAVTKGNKNTIVNLGSLDASDNDYYSCYISNIPNNSTVEITIADAVKKAKPVVKMKAGEQFGEFNGEDSVSISQNSSFTVEYEMKNMVASHYNNPALTLSVQFPKGASIIMINGSDYWYYKSNDNVAEKTPIALSSFKKMGGTSNYSFGEDSSTTFRFVVDYSKVETGLLTDETEIMTSLSFTKRNKGEGELDNIPNISADSDNVTSKAKATFVLDKDSGSENPGSSRILTLKYNRSDGFDSIVNKKSFAIVLTAGDDMPTDAIMKVTKGEESTNYSMNKSKQFIIPLAELEDVNELKITMETKEIFTERTSYDVKVVLYMADAGESPENGENVGTYVGTWDGTLTFAQEAYAPISLSITDGNRIVNVGGALKVEVNKCNLTEEMSIIGSVMWKDADGKYVDTGLKPTITNGNNTIALGNSQVGSYCLMASVVKSGIVLLKVPYYFVIR